MKPVKILLIALVTYVGLVLTFETLLGIFQPDAGVTLVITTTDNSGNTNDRVLAMLETDGKIYVAANHWPRAWYNQAVENPMVHATIDGEKHDFLAVAVSEAEHARIQKEHDTGIMFRILTGFPKRIFLRLDPRDPA